MDFPKQYPKQMPRVLFTTPVFHPLVDPASGQLRLQTEFSEWAVGKDWVIQVLLYMKKIFHLEMYYSLENEIDNAWNPEAFNLYHSKFQVFVDRCLDCVELSIRDRFDQEANRNSFKLSEPNEVSEKILARIHEFIE